MSAQGNVRSSNGRMSNMPVELLRGRHISPILTTSTCRPASSTQLRTKSVISRHKDFRFRLPALGSGDLVLRTRATAKARIDGLAENVEDFSIKRNKHTLAQIVYTARKFLASSEVNMALRWTVSVNLTHISQSCASLQIKRRTRSSYRGMRSLISKTLLKRFLLKLEGCCLSHTPTNGSRDEML